MSDFQYDIIISILFMLIAFVVCLTTLRQLLAYLKKKSILDIPNERSSHSIPTPRGGGISVALSIVSLGLLLSIYLKNLNLGLIVLSSGVISLLGWIDDFRGGLSTKIRFVVQLIIASVIFYKIGVIQKLPFPEPLDISFEWFAIPISIMWLVGITNIFNFLDGIDGIAGTQATITGLALGLFTFGTPISYLGFVIAGASIGFLMLNWHPAKIFMGDVGSAFLGFLFAVIPFYFLNEKAIVNPEEVFFTLAIFLWFFLLDGTYTMIRRLVKGEKIWEAHRSHIYQRLVIAGWKHNQVVQLLILFYSIIALVFVVSTKALSLGIINWVTLSVAFALFIVYILICSNAEKKKQITLNA